ncbi:endonuclease [Clostridium luticellarii]|uniref:LAGLIDADG DNA endonuclease family protein n=1 Tax=Clostridium luticellarii TaxID=1691940 RepID=A0A2T0B6Y6_9CLOT|nr:endonuclease [Clostridium luticellarii]PRR79625.1 LAGLIDADG DNA endonuclease family protein [Clostridium luticellarii]
MPFAENTKVYKMNRIERNIIIGSLIGDGSLALYGRSINAYYREHGCAKQIPYREWKAKKLKNLNFKLLTNCKNPQLRSPSSKTYTELYNMFYRGGEKIITLENILLLDHPIGLACLYMDDGSLVIDSSKRKNGSIYIFPRISIYTLNFSKDENIILQNHIKKTFNINTKLKERKDGKHFLLEINKRNDIVKFIKTISPFVEEIPCMHYKIKLKERFEDKRLKLINEGYKNINKWCENITENKYSKEEENFIIKSKQAGASSKKIADFLGRSYWGILDKLKRLKLQGRI